MALTVLQEGAQGDSIAHPITLAAATTPGHTLLLVNASTIDNNGVPGTTGWGGIDSITDPRGNQWTRIAAGPTQDGVDSGTTLEVWACPVVHVHQATDQIVANGDARGLSMVYTLFDAGALAATPVDVQGGGAASSWHAPFTDPPTAGTAAASDLILGITAIGDGHGVSITPAAGWTVVSDHGDAVINRQLQVCTETAPAGSQLAFHAEAINPHAFQCVVVALTLGSGGGGGGGGTGTGAKTTLARQAIVAALNGQLTLPSTWVDGRLNPPVERGDVGCSWTEGTREVSGRVDVEEVHVAIRILSGTQRGRGARQALDPGKLEQWVEDAQTLLSAGQTTIVQANGAGWYLRVTGSSVEPRLGYCDIAVTVWRDNVFRTV